MIVYQFFLFDLPGLLIVIFGCFFGGFLPLMILLMLTPEARAHITARVKGGVVVEKFYDTGQIEYVVAKPLAGEGQYMAGQNKFGQREIFFKPRIGDRFMVKNYLLSGMRRLKFFAYAGKTVMVNHGTLMAISTVEAEKNTPIELPKPFMAWAKKKYPKMIEEFDDLRNNGGDEFKIKDLPPDVREWAKEYGIKMEEPEMAVLTEPEYGVPDENGIVKATGNYLKVRAQVGVKNIFYPLIDLDARKLKDYFSDHYDESQADNLLEQARTEGISEGREGKRLNIGMLGKVAIAFIVIAIIGTVVVIGLQGGL